MTTNYLDLGSALKDVPTLPANLDVEKILNTIHSLAWVLELMLTLACTHTTLQEPLTPPQLAKQIAPFTAPPVSN
jgi:hypothetical protein